MEEENGFLKLLQKISDPAQRDTFTTEMALQGPSPMEGRGGFFDAAQPPIPGATPGIAPPAVTQQAAIPLPNAGPPTPAPANTPTPEQELAANKGSWERFADWLQTDEGRRTGLEFAARMFQPPKRGQNAAGVFGEALVGSLGSLDARRAAAKESEIKEREVSAMEDKNAADIRKTDRAIISADYIDDLNAAKAEWMRRRQDGTAGGAEKLIYDSKVKAWFTAHPGKFVDLKDAEADLVKFEATKGNPPFAKAMEALLQDIPIWKKDVIQPIMDMVQEYSAIAAEVPKSARVLQAEEQAKLEATGVTDADWRALSKNPTLRLKWEQQYGAEYITRKINEAMRGQ